MKKLIALAAFVLASSPSFADAPRSVQLDMNAIDTLNAIGHVSSEFEELLKHGNTFTSATVESMGSNQTFRITVRQCRRLPLTCLGGATLTIEKAMRNTRPTTWSYEARVDLLR